MKKPLVNIFFYGDGTHIHAIGWRTYKRAGTHEELTNFLQSRVQRDHRDSQREDLPKPMLWRDFEVMDRLHPFVNELNRKGPRR